MSLHLQTSPSVKFKGLLKSYGEDLKGWTTRIAIRYVIAVALLLSAGAGFIAAIGVGIAALFHYLESLYGLNVAYAAIGGLLLCISLLGALTAILLLKVALPPMPRPRRRHTKAVERSLAANAMLAASAPNRTLLKPDSTTEVMVGLAAACLVGWLVLSRIDQSRATAKLK
jgi:anti-sigma factor RsiW